MQFDQKLWNLYNGLTILVSEVNIILWVIKHMLIINLKAFCLWQ